MGDRLGGELEENFVPARGAGSSDTPPLPTLLVNLQQRLGAPGEIRSRTGWTECGAAGTFIGERQSSRKVEVPTSPQDKAARFLA
jgi:hypothetical protein